MTKVGVINYFVDEYHGTFFSQWLNEKSGGDVRVAYAYALADSPPVDHPFPLRKRTTDQWCSDYGIEQCASIEMLVSKSDALMVCCPDYPEFHEQLCQLPLRSGKPTFVDKVFAPDFITAKRLFSLANEYNTPVYSCSALRFMAEFTDVNTDDIVDIAFWSGADDVHIIHQIEPLMLLMKSKAKRLLCLLDGDYARYTVEFADGRYASMAGYHVIKDTPLLANIFHKDRHETITVQSDIFHEFILKLADFLKTGDVKVKQEDTLDIIGVYEAAILSRQSSGTWINIRQQ